MSDNSVCGFSRQYKNIPSQLLIPIHIIDPITWDSSIECQGLIDTWATNCVISSRMASELNLIQSWLVKTYHAWGVSDCKQYTVKLELPDSYITNTLLVTEWPIDLQGFDVLIGMDVITEGDFTMTKKDGWLLISFITPSQWAINLVERYIAKRNVEKKIKKQQQERLNGKNNRKKKKRK